MTLRRTLLLPMLALMAAVVGGTVALSRALVARAVESRLTQQTNDLAAYLSGPGVPLNARSLEHIAAATDAEAMVVRDGAVYLDFSSLPAAESARILAEPGDAIVVTAPVIVDGQPMRLYVVMPPDVVEREKSAALGPLLTAGVVAIGLAALMAVVLSMNISRPIEELAAAARANADLPVPKAAPREVEELAAAFNRLIETVRRAEQLSTVGRVAAMMAHELRNPLSSMKLNVQLLRERGDEKARDHATRLLVEIERLEGALNVLLDAARPAPLQRERASMSALVRDVAEFLRPRLDHWKVAVEIDAPGPCEASIDAGRMRGVVMNLLLNAAQAMPSGGRVDVSVRNGEGTVRLDVRDAGAGVPPQMRDRLFEPLSPTREDGLGLGLAVVRRIVEEHGGRAGYEPAEPGSRFWVELPA